MVCGPGTGPEDALVNTVAITSLPRKRRSSQLVAFFLGLIYALPARRRLAAAAFLRRSRRF
jgi:hypothetical protein